MGLSGWPEHWDDKKPSSRSAEIVDFEFEDEVFVAVVTERSIGLKHAPEDRDVAAWIPISLIDGDVPERGEWIASISIPKWKTDDLEF